MIADDWLTDAAAQARTQIARTIRPRFNKKQWKEFDHRLAENFEGLFRRLHLLYGWQYDFAWTVESLVQVAVTGYLDRTKRLRRLDRAGASSVDQQTTWAMAYPDRLTADQRGLTDQVGYLKGLGITHLHLMGPAPVDSLADVVDGFHEAGMSLVLDFTLSHTSSDHKWAQAAAVGEEEESFYFLFTDRSIPDDFAPRLRSNASGRGGDSFTWHPEVQGGRWVWTTFESSNWDLNYANPRVLAAMASELFAVANLGVGAVRLPSLAQVWKAAGTTCEDLPEAHVIVQVLRLLADIAAPSFEFATDDARYVSDDECHLGYHTLVMSSVWEAIATTDTRLLRVALGKRLQRQQGCLWLNYLRDGDQITWGFVDEDADCVGIDPPLHRRYLNGFYAGQEPGSFARGFLIPPDAELGVAQIAGSLASLAGLEAATENMDPSATELAVRRILAAWAVVIAVEGIPMFLLGDEIATFNDPSYESEKGLAGDTRWMHRPRFDQARRERALAGIGPEGEILAGIMSLLAARRGMTEVDPTAPVEVVDPGAMGVVAFRRGPSLLVANLTDRIALISRDSFPEGAYFDVVRQEVWDGHVLGPYEHRLVRL